MIDIWVRPTILAGIATDLDPLIITSPLARSGATHLQRLFCLASNTLIYGERAAQVAKAESPVRA